MGYATVHQLDDYDDARISVDLIASDGTMLASTEAKGGRRITVVDGGYVSGLAYSTTVAGWAAQVVLIGPADLDTRIIFNPRHGALLRFYLAADMDGTISRAPAIFAAKKTHTPVNKVRIFFIT